MQRENPFIHFPSESVVFLISGDKHDPVFLHYIIGTSH